MKEILKLNFLHKNKLVVKFCYDTKNEIASKFSTILKIKKLGVILIMPYTKEEGGLINNFAAEPKMYKAEPPTKKEQRNFIILGIFGFLVVGGSIFLAVFASSAT
jgi:hypothetical protein